MANYFYIKQNDRFKKEPDMNQIIYFTDPMCSWCYGFAPVVDEIKLSFGHEVEITPIAGGYSPGTTEPMSQEYKDMLQGAWRKINEVTGQPFDFSMQFAGEDFCYDTEPSSRAFTTVQQISPENDWNFLKAMQSAFYAENNDLTKDEVLADIAEAQGVDKEQFLKKFHSDEMKQLTLKGFASSQKMGVRGFPTLVGVKKEQAYLLSNGYQPFTSLEPVIAHWLQL